MARFRGLPRSLRLGFLALALLGGLTTYVWAQGVGIFSRSLCTSLTSPVAGQTFCFEQSSNTLKFYTGAATAPWVNVTATESSVNNVRDFGAVGNNVADDTTAIINAIARDYNAGTQNGTAQTNRIVFFPPGIYKITSAIEVPPNVIIRGTGRFSVDTVSGTGFTASIINKSHNGVAFRFVDRNGIATGSLWQMGGIEDMGFSGNGASDTTASRFIELGDANTVNTATGSWEVFIRRNTFSTSSGYGIYSAHSQTANIEQNWFNSVKFPIYYNTVVSAARIERNTFLDQTVIAGAIAIQMRPGSLGGSAGGPMIVGNYFLGFQYGLWVTSIVGPQIRDNVLESTQHSPIQLDAFLSDTVTQDGSGPVSGVVDGNTFINWGAAGANEPAIRLNYTQNFYIGAQAYHSPNAAVVTSHIALFDNACSPQCTKNNVIVDPICTGSNCGTTPGVPNSSVTLQNTIIGRNYLQQQTVAGDLSGLGGGHAGRFWWNASSKSLRLFDGSSTFSVASFAELNINGPGVQVGAPTGGAKGTGQLNATAIYVNGKLVVTASGAHVNSSVTFASGLLNTLTADGMQIYCSDCTAAGALDQTCVGGGTGNLAVRVNGVAKCAY